MLKLPSRKLLIGAMAGVMSLQAAAASAFAHAYERGKARGRFTPDCFTTDEMFTIDSAIAQAYPGCGVTGDSSGVFLVSELERLDRTLNAPLYSTTWSRDIILRTDVSLGDEIASWTLTNYASPGLGGGLYPSGVNWAASNANANPGPAVDIGRYPQPLYPWVSELSWTVFDLAKSMILGIPIDVEKYEAMNTKWDMDVDQVVYTGEAAFGQYGFMNSPSITATAVANGGSGTAWTTKTPQQILADLNTALNTTWAASGYKVMPSEVRLPPANFTYINGTVMSVAGTTGGSSILRFLRENNASEAISGKPLNIQPLKWAIGAGAGATNRMVVYERDAKFIRYPMVPRQRTPLELRSIFQAVTYYAKLGFVEWRYPETASYWDGI